LERGKLVAVAVQENSKQSLRGQVHVKLTPEICINKASSNSRLTAVGRQATASDRNHRIVSRLFFFLPTFDETKLPYVLKNLLKLYCI
jgi:hypothetical protein